MIEASIAQARVQGARTSSSCSTRRAHGDHAGGFAALKKRTGAKLMVSAADADVIERGGTRDFSLGDSLTFPAATVDRRLKDGDTVALGGTTLTAHLTPGHTMGCTTWTFDAERSRPHAPRRRSVRLVDSREDPRQRHARLSGHHARTTSAPSTTLKALPIDIFIGAHPSYYGGMEKAAKAKADPSGPESVRRSRGLPQGGRRAPNASSAISSRASDKQREPWPNARTASDQLLVCAARRSGRCAPARRAGQAQASSPTASSNSETTAERDRIEGGDAPDLLRRNRPAATLPSEPSAVPASSSRVPRAITIRAIVAAAGAERHADADLLSFLRDRARHHAVDADDGQRQADVPRTSTAGSG